MPGEFVLSRVLDAPRDLVWKCFTDAGAYEAVVGPERLQRHCFENGFARGRNLPLRDEGAKRRPDVGQVHLSRNCPTGANGLHQFVFGRKGGVTRHPGSPTWPLEMLSTFTFEELPDGKTKFTVRWAPHNATAEEQKTFDSSPTA